MGGKNDFLTPKAIANRIKAKGLQKLRWYCQMCQKQCRDENGFKCHCMSESHRRQMEVFGQNPERFVDGYSEEFEQSFLEHVKRTHRFSRVAATVVYNEYINDRHHIHMNSTKWTTLTEFVKHLGRTGQCKIDETPKGWFLTYIDREPETLFKEGQKSKRQRAELAEEERNERAIQEQIERAAKAAKTESANATETDVSIQRDTGEGEEEAATGAILGGKIAFSFPPKSATDSASSSSKALKSSAAATGGVPSVFEEKGEEAKTEGVEGDDKSIMGEKKKRKDEHASGGTNISKDDGTRSAAHRNPSTLEKLMLEEEQAKEKQNRKDNWLCEGIVVKVMSKKLKENGYYKQKGVVQKVIGKYVGEIKLSTESGHVLLRVDQAELETVLPKLGGTVRIVNGAYRGCNAILKSINTENYTACVKIDKGAFDGRIIPSIDYEDICKLAG